MDEVDVHDTAPYGAFTRMSHGCIQLHVDESCLTVWLP